MNVDKDKLIFTLDALKQRIMELEEQIDELKQHNRDWGHRWIEHDKFLESLPENHGGSE